MKNYGMNGRVGRAKTLRSLRRDQIAQAKAAGVDVTDRKAVKAYQDAQFRALCDRIKARQ